jgi:hypothetical protein
LKKGDIGGFALYYFGKIPPTPLYKGGILFTDKFLIPLPFKAGYFGGIRRRGLNGAV